MCVYTTVLSLSLLSSLSSTLPTSPHSLPSLPSLPSPLPPNFGLLPPLPPPHSSPPFLPLTLLPFPPSTALPSLSIPSTPSQIIRQQFPSLTTRRLGTRGQSKWVHTLSVDCVTNSWKCCYNYTSCFLMVHSLG